MNEKVTFHGNPNMLTMLCATTVPQHPFKADIGIRRVNPDAQIPVYNKDGDSGFDLVAMDTVIIEPGGTVTIPTGLQFELPLGLELQIRPRSGLTSKTKARVDIGTVDSNYRGEIKVSMDNFAYPIWFFNAETQGVEILKTRKVKTLTNEIDEINHPVPYGSIIIHKGQRIAQGVLAVVYKGKFTEKEQLSETARGVDGFGSSGV